MGVELLESLFCNNMIGGNSDKTETKVIWVVLIVLIILVLYMYFKNHNLNSNANTISNGNGNGNSNANTISNGNGNGNSNANTISNGNGNVRTEIKTEEIIVPVKPIPNVYPMLREYDYRTYNDDLTPPRKRDDYDIPAQVFYPDKYGLYTRGGPNPFKKMGFLNNKNAQPGDSYKFLTLMGRQKYYNSNTYEYYVVSTNKDENIKFDIPKNRELFTGDTVKVPQLNNTEYEVNIDKVLEYEYNPYII